jgi:hypothetical protein
MARLWRVLMSILELALAATATWHESVVKDGLGLPIKAEEVPDTGLACEIEYLLHIEVLNALNQFLV